MAYYTTLNYPTSYGNVTVTAGGLGGASGSSSTILTGAVGAGAITLTGAGAGTNWTTATNPYIYTTAGSNGTQNSLQVKGDANFEGDVKIRGISITETLAKIQERLAILVPDPARLEKYEALKQAYEHYKLLEALCVDETDLGEKK